MYFDKKTWRRCAVIFQVLRYHEGIILKAQQTNKVVFNPDRKPVDWNYLFWKWNDLWFVSFRTSKCYGRCGPYKS
jgi:hypothetical protein